MKLLISFFAFLFFAVPLSFGCGGGDSGKAKVVRGKNGRAHTIYYDENGNPDTVIRHDEYYTEHKEFCAAFEQQSDCENAIGKHSFRCRWVEDEDICLAK
uniref:Lipoprotein n=1 Tax=Globodera rostochiensis TaxID=31243 RepID=A0A914HNG2_GLORO